MPNGHGGKPILATPVILTVIFAGVTKYAVRAQPPMLWIAVGLVLAAAAGWRVAYDLHMRHTDAYSGAHTSPEELRNAKARYRNGTIVYVTVAVALGCAVLWWRGFFSNLQE